MVFSKLRRTEHFVHLRHKHRLYQNKIPIVKISKHFQLTKIFNKEQISHLHQTIRKQQYVQKFIINYQTFTATSSRQNEATRKDGL